MYQFSLHTSCFSLFGCFQLPFFIYNLFLWFIQMLESNWSQGNAISCLDLILSVSPYVLTSFWYKMSIYQQINKDVLFQAHFPLYLETRFCQMQAPVKVQEVCILHFEWHLLLTFTVVSENTISNTAAVTRSIPALFIKYFKALKCFKVQWIRHNSTQPASKS